MFRATEGTTRRRVAVITGASAGIGRATARAFGQRGWRVGLIARGVDGLEEARREIEEAGGEAMVLPVDVADQAAVSAAGERVVDQWSAIDVWVNCAMVTVFCEVSHVAPEDFRRATEVTYLGAVWGTQTALRHMLPRNEGVIVQVGSALAYRSIPLQSAYCGAKAAIRGFTDSLRSELIHHGSRIHLTMVHLSAFNTPQFDWCRSCVDSRLKPLGRVFQPEVAAEAIYWASQHRRRESWVGWPAVQAILGNRVIPGLLDRYLAKEGYEGQTTGEPPESPRPDNLYHPVPGDHGAHGRFDRKARNHSLEWLLRTRRTPLVLGAAALLLLAARPLLRAVRNRR